jgi:hypothetical protein
VEADKATKLPRPSFQPVDTDDRLVDRQRQLPRFPQIH